jgi:hypothetical protein
MFDFLVKYMKESFVPSIEAYSIISIPNTTGFYYPCPSLPEPCNSMRVRNADPDSELAVRMMFEFDQDGTTMALDAIYLPGHVPDPLTYQNPPNIRVEGHDGLVTVNHCTPPGIASSFTVDTTGFTEAKAKAVVDYFLPFYPRRIVRDKARTLSAKRALAMALHPRSQKDSALAHTLSRELLIIIAKFVDFSLADS